MLVENDRNLLINTDLVEEHRVLKQKYEELETQCDVYKSQINQYEQLKMQAEETVTHAEYEEVIRKMLDILNTIDQISSAYKNTVEHQLVAEQLEKVAGIAIHQMSSLGIAEIPVFGKEIDGELMESFGVAMHVSDESLQPHQVAIVQRRAFKKQDTGEVIQHALVYTVPEEE